MEVNQCLVGGQDARGRAAASTTRAIVLGAVEARLRKRARSPRPRAPATRTAREKPLKRATYAGRLRLQVVKNREQAHVRGLRSRQREAKRLDRTARTAGSAYDGLKAPGYRHLSASPLHEATPRPRTQHLHFLIRFDLLQLEDVDPRHAPRDLRNSICRRTSTEYTFRFNRRFYPMTAFNTASWGSRRGRCRTNLRGALLGRVAASPAAPPKAPQLEMPFA